MKEKLKTLDDTAEQPIKMNSYHTLGYRKGIDFWADGANVPYNYVSGYVHGLLESSNDISAYHSLSAAFLDPLISLENLATNNLWHYWWGLGRSGWTENDNVSTNTPIYAGTDGIAHISYRSMDAMAVLKLSSLMPSAIDIRVVQNLRRLVSNGSLLPFVNQELINLGGAQRLDRAVSIRYARSANSSELQAQVFALEDLAGR